MKDLAQLYGRAIDGAQKASLTAQAHDALVSEIQAGHWQIGDRLPGIGSLAEESGVGRTPLQRAFEQLRREGYIRQTKGSGSYLVSVDPSHSGSNGVIGIAAPVRESDSRWDANYNIAFRLSVIKQVAARHNYKIEVEYLSDRDDWTRVTRVGEVFSPDVKGVISLKPFAHCEEGQIEISRDRLPFVYYGSNSSTCLPVVCGDTHDGFYRLTKRVIAAGHRNIIFLGDPQEPDRELQNRFHGYRQAMKAAGLAYESDATRQSLALRPGNLKMIREFLERWSAATAIVSTWKILTQDIIAVAEMMGRRVPEDLSVVGHGPREMRPLDETREITRVEYDASLMVDTCLDLLKRQIADRRRTVARVLITPRIIAGDSLASPRAVRSRGALAATK